MISTVELAGNKTLEIRVLLLWFTELVIETHCQCPARFPDSTIIGKLCGGTHSMTNADDTLSTHGESGRNLLQSIRFLSSIHDFTLGQEGHAW